MNSNKQQKISEMNSDIYQMNCTSTILKTPSNNKFNKQDNKQLRDLLLKYSVIEEDDSKFNFKQEDSQNSNNLDSQKSTFLSQYRRNINYVKRNDYGMEEEEEEQKEVNFSGRDVFGNAFSKLLKTKSKDKQSLFGYFSPREINPPYMVNQELQYELQDEAYILETDKKDEDRNNIWNTDAAPFDQENIKKKQFQITSSSSIDSSQSRDQDDKSNNLNKKRNIKRPLTSIGQLNKKTKNNFTLNLAVDQKQKKGIAKQDFTPTKAKPLEGKSVFVDVYTNDRENISNSVHSILNKLGADIKKKFTKNVDLVIWKDGSDKNYENAHNQKIPILNIHWLEKCLLENKFVETTPEYLVPKPQKTVNDLSTRVDKIYQKYEKNKEKEIKKKAKAESIPIQYKKKDDSFEEDSILDSWQKTFYYQQLQQKQLKDEIRCQEELEQYYHDIIQECYQGKFTTKWLKRKNQESLIEKYEQTNFNMENIIAYNTQLNKDPQISVHTSSLPDLAEEKILFVGMDSIKKQQKTMQDFFCMNKITANTNKENNTNNLKDQKQQEQKQSNDKFVTKTEQQINIQNKMEVESEGQMSQQSSQAKQVKSIELSSQKSLLFTAKKPIPQTSQNSTSQKSSLADLLSKKKSTIATGSLLSQKKLVFPSNSVHNNNINNSSSLMRFGFSFQKIQKQNSINSDNQDKNKKIGYINLSQNQIQQLQNCQSLYLKSYQLCEEKDQFQEDVIIVGNQITNSQHNAKGNNSSLNQLRILSLLTSGKEILNFKWIEDCNTVKGEIPLEDYREYNSDWNKNIFTGFDFSIYLDQVQRKNKEIMKQKLETERVIKYFGGRVLENSKNANYTIFFKQYSKLPQGYDASNCVSEKWVFDSIFNKSILSKQQYLAVQ
ncbi:BRCA1 carboxy-terminus (BRCT) domain protein (macronuclear) [Tetrahymena thermophila SB210]|uniref:BRCA1 carboxy-terminus (BRCT) domain protein n=1 Tax=Tetrahymena thermophila (strain SB210) TaxID=312017 RepID=Q233C0_TETTS|nr:BRCA1 carboxy-terminus (BRCT) domain protein [Tetrahymena thermophila SB210]EAR91660.4 BRCA1 carboxy-terminus (BRCT) domain protein [Tetrahymena thermophila SB210]|eukprot:XP_001011905.4 BRCA1 carboxy-terminus (BRCT) domain protein [Tetrahymena thermophila SB210]